MFDTIELMQNYFQASKEHKYHISVGAVVLNEKDEVCVHHFDAKKLKGYWTDQGLDDFYILMRETMHPNETLEQTLGRGLMEEFGIKAQIVDFIGSKKDNFFHNDIEMEKTTLYFLTELLSQDVSRRDKSDIEGETDIEWHDIDFLIEKMKKQEKVFKRGDVNEASILEEVKQILK